jgi:hypothetical protein
VQAQTRSCSTPWLQYASIGTQVRSVVSPCMGGCNVMDVTNGSGASPMARCNKMGGRHKWTGGGGSYDSVFEPTEANLYATIVVCSEPMQENRMTLSTWLRPLICFSAGPIMSSKSDTVVPTVKRFGASFARSTFAFAVTSLPESVSICSTCKEEISHKKTP